MLKYLFDREPYLIVAEHERLVNEIRSRIIFAYFEPEISRRFAAFIERLQFRQILNRIVDIIVFSAVFVERFKVADRVDRYVRIIRPGFHLVDFVDADELYGDFSGNIFVTFLRLRAVIASLHQLVVGGAAIYFIDRYIERYGVMAKIRGCDFHHLANGRRGLARCLCDDFAGLHLQRCDGRINLLAQGLQILQRHAGKIDIRKGEGRNRHEQGENERENLFHLLALPLNFFEATTNPMPERAKPMPIKMQRRPMSPKPKLEEIKQTMPSKMSKTPIRNILYLPMIIRTPRAERPANFRRRPDSG
nr:MAG TPA: hypothetical protein [Caudoviricetes sp.]